MADPGHQAVFSDLILLASLPSCCHSRNCRTCWEPGLQDFLSPPPLTTHPETIYRMFMNQEGWSELWPFTSPLVWVTTSTPGLLCDQGERPSLGLFPCK